VFNETRFPYTDLFSKSISSSTPTSLSSFLANIPLVGPPLVTPLPNTVPNSPSPPPQTSQTHVLDSGSDIQSVPTSPIPQNSQTPVLDSGSDTQSVPTYSSPIDSSSTATVSSPTSSESASQYPIPQNSHPMQTRAKSGIVQTCLHPSLFLSHTEPKSAKHALQDPNWQSAMQAEFDALVSNKTCTLVPLPGRQAIGCKWIFRIKENPDGSINRYKARLVAIGFHQVQGYDFNETFSPVVKPTTIRLILTLALSHHWKLH